MGGSKKMSRVFNTSFELSLRLLILLSIVTTASSADKLSALDFITTYGKSFQISDYNLNGDNDLKFSEFSSRRSLIKKALISLFLRGMVIPKETASGFDYEITDYGEKQVLLLTDDYACRYKEIAILACAYASNKSEQTLITDINHKAANALRRVAINE